MPDTQKRLGEARLLNLTPKQPTESAHEQTPTPTSLAADIKSAIEWGAYLHDGPDLLVSLKQAVFDAAKQMIACRNRKSEIPPTDTIRGHFWTSSEVTCRPPPLSRPARPSAIK